MDKRHDDAVITSFQHQDPRVPRALAQPFAPFQSSYATPLKLLELGRPLLPFSSPRLQGRPFPFHQPWGRRDDAAAAGMGVGLGLGDNNNESQDRLMETNSSLTPLNLDRSPSLLEGSQSTSGVTPLSWSSLYSAFKVPSLNSHESNPKSNSNARNVPHDGHSIELPRDEPQNSGEGNQRVPVVQNAIGAGAGAGASSQFSNSWPVGEGINALVLGGRGGGGPVGSDRGSFTAAAPFSQRPKLPSGQKNAKPNEALGSSPKPMMHSDTPIYAPIPSYAFPRAAVGDNKGKSKMVDSSTMDLDPERDGKHLFKRPPGVTRLPIATGSPTAMAMDVSKAVAMDVRASTSRPQLQQGLNGSKMSPVRGDCNDESGAGKRCDSKEVNAQEDRDHDQAQPMVTCEAQPFCGPGVELVTGNIKSKVGRQSTTEAAAAAERSGQKQSRHRNSSDALEEAGGTSSFIKRSRQHVHPRYRSWTFQAEGSEQLPQTRTEQANGMRTETVQTCNWLQRWLPAGSSVLSANVLSTAAAAAAAAGRTKERQWNGPVPDGGHGRRNVGLSDTGPEPMEVNYSKSSTDHNMWNDDMTRFQNRLSMTDFSTRNGLFKLTPFSTPSASALAMMGTASRSLGPPFTQGKDSILLRPSESKKVKHVQFAE